MSTNGITSWAVDLADIGAIYPFQGTEWLWLIAAIALWIWVHIMHVRRVGGDMDQSQKEFETEETEKIIDKY